MSDGRFGYVPNLHIVLDGENRARAGAYVPFGVELVRKLIRQGRYANSKTVAVDDAVITAKVVGEQRWLRIWVGGRCELYMESGIVHVGSIGPANPAFNDDGKLYLNPALEAMPELNGLLSLPLATEDEPKPVSGATAESFKKKTKTDDNGNVTVDQDSLSELQRKKLTVTTVPPSLFTGKTRLYVQSIYGRRLKHFKKWSANIAFQPPALRYSGRYKGEDYTVDISTNAGIFTTEDYNYFLLQVMGGSNQYVTVRKLVAESVCVDRARAYLVANKDELTEEKKTALEAYILSGSYPSDEIKFNLDAVITTNWQMGYGWHFNWSGTACDIVQVDTINTGGSTYKHKSTHYRMGFSRDKDKTIPVSDPPLTPAQQERMRWAAIEQTTVETAEWKNYKWQHVIAFPDWGAQQLEVFGQPWGDRFGDAAPIYCFYRRDELNVVRYSCSGGVAVGAQRMAVSSPAYFYGSFDWGELTGWPCTSTTVGFEGGRTELRERGATPVSAGFQVGAVSVSSTDNLYTLVIREVSAKARNYDEAWYGWNFFTDPIDGYTGRQAVAASSAYGCALSYTPGDAITIPGMQSQRLAIYSGVRYTGVSAGGSHQEATEMLCVIPFGDAEAAYLWGRQYVAETLTGTTGVVDDNRSTNHIRVSQYTITGELVLEVGAQTDFTVADAYSSSTAEYVSLGAYFISGNGVQTFDPNSATVVSAFFAGEPNTHVAQTFWTLTSAGLRDTDGAGTELTGGYAQDGHVFVGHA